MKSFLKWAGGKFRILQELREKFPITAKRFVEPFLGAGNISLNVDYPDYIVNDINKDLYHMWKYLQDNVSFIKDCEELFVQQNNTEERFSLLRQEFNETEDQYRKSILFIYLNRHCFNGLCRYNSSGFFNVPFGRYTKPYFPKKEMQSALAKVNKFKIFNLDFRDVFKMVQEEDLVYCDPPYLPISASANFNAYSAEKFSLKDQLDLASCAKQAVEKGASVVISNHDNWYSRQIYIDGNISTLKVSRTINSKISKRIPVDELIVTYIPL